MVRYEVKARLPRTLSTTIEHLADDLPQTHSSAKMHRCGGLTYQRFGRLVPQAELVEFATRTEKTALTTHHELFPQIYLGNTPNLVIAIHDYGHFFRRNHEILGVDPSLVQAFEEAQHSLKELRVLLGTLQTLAVNHTGEQLTVVSQQGVLKIFVRQSGTALPEEFLAEFT